MELVEAVWGEPVPGRPTLHDVGGGDTLRLREGTFITGFKIPLSYRPQGAARDPACPGLLPRHHRQARQPLPPGLPHR